MRSGVITTGLLPFDGTNIDRSSFLGVAPPRMEKRAVHRRPSCDFRLVVESSVLQGAPPRSGNPVLQRRCLWLRLGESTGCQPSQRRVQNSEGILASNLYSDRFQTIPNQRNCLIVCARKTQNLKAKCWKADLFSFFFRWQDASQCGDSLLKLRDSEIEIVPFLNPLGQFRFGSSQPLPLRVLVDDHDVTRLPHA